MEQFLFESKHNSGKNGPKTWNQKEGTFGAGYWESSYGINNDRKTATGRYQVIFWAERDELRGFYPTDW